MFSEYYEFWYGAYKSFRGIELVFGVVMYFGIKLIRIHRSRMSSPNLSALPKNVSANMVSRLQRARTIGNAARVFLLGEHNGLKKFPRMLSEIGYDPDDSFSHLDEDLGLMDWHPHSIYEHIITQLQRDAHGRTDRMATISVAECSEPVQRALKGMGLVELRIFQGDVTVSDSIQRNYRCWLVLGYHKMQSGRRRFRPGGPRERQLHELTKDCTYDAQAIIDAHIYERFRFKAQNLLGPIRKFLTMRWLRIHRSPRET